jgi:hypothetical protein
MPELNLIFNPEDPGFLRLVAEFWGVEELEKSFEDLFSELKALISDKEIFAEVLDTLSPPAKDALHFLAVKGGKMPWADFSNHFGLIREMGAGRRDRIHPYSAPESLAETLFYRGFLGKVFLDEKPEPREFVFIPDEILVGLQKIDPEITSLPGQPFQPGQIHHYIRANDNVLQDACTLLTGLRLALAETEIKILPLTVEERSLRELLKGCGLIDEQGKVQSGAVKTFLEMPRSKALSKLANSWRTSDGSFDLYKVDDLVIEKKCPYDPISVNEQVLETLNQVPANTWWDLNSFIQFFHSHHPNFLRPSGDFESWFIREKETGQYLQGFEVWNKIEGRLLEFMVSRPLHWLGFLDLGFSSQADEPSCFCISRWWSDLYLRKVLSFPDPPPEDVFINSRGKVSVPTSSSLAVRYQIGRFAKYLDTNPYVYFYQLSNSSLKNSKKQGLKTHQLVKIIQNHSSSPFPPVLFRALQNWESMGAQVHFDSLKVVRFSNPSIVDILIKSKAGKFIRESLNPTTIAYDPAGEKIIKSILLEAGYFSEDEKEKEV